MIHFRLRYERLRDRLRQVARGVALARAGLVGVLVGGAGAVMTALDPGGPWAHWPLVALLATAVAEIALDSRARRTPIDALLDRRFELDELIVTAVEVDRRGPRNGLEVRLLDDAASALAGLGGERAVSWRPVAVEIEQLLGAGLLALGLVLLAHVRGTPVLPGRLPAVPGLAGLGAGGGSADGGQVPGRGAGDGASPGTGGGPSPGQRALADALADQAAAGDAASALRRGDEAGSARALRALADAAPRVSEAGRDGLQAALDAAAEAIAPTEPEFARELRGAARDIASPDPARAAAALERLAARIEGGASRALATPPLADADAGGRAARLPVAATPVDLASAPGGAGRRTAADPTAPDALQEASRARAGTARDDAGSAHGDPLGVSLAERGLVRRYFAPRAVPAGPDAVPTGTGRTP